MTTKDPFYKWMKSLEKTYIKFNRDNKSLDFVPAHFHSPTKDGFYIIIKCGLAGISSNLNEWKNGQWQCHCLDGSTVIAYSRETVEFPENKGE